MDFKILAGDKLSDFFFPLDDDRKCWRLDPADCGEKKPTLFRIKCGHGTRTIDSDQPIRFGATAGRISKRLHGGVSSQVIKGIADRGCRHRLQPETLNGVF